MSEFAELLSPATNHAVVQLPGRRFPGVVLQGDSLHILVKNLQRLREAAAKHGDAELDDGFACLCEQLTGVSSHFEAVCRSRGLALPYPDRSAD